MFDDLPHNLETAHQIGMTTVLVHGLTDHPEHQAMAGWTELPAHIHHRTDALPPFLAKIGTTLAENPGSAPSLAHLLPPRPAKLSFPSAHDPRPPQDFHRQRL